MTNTNNKPFPILIPLHLQLCRLHWASGGGGRAAAGGGLLSLFLFPIAYSLLPITFPLIPSRTRHRKRTQKRDYIKEAKLPIIRKVSLTVSDSNHIYKQCKFWGTKHYIANTAADRPGKADCVYFSHHTRKSPSMITRIKRYAENNGPIYTLINIGVLGFLIWFHTGYDNLATVVVMESLVVSAFLLPYFTIRWSHRHPMAAYRMTKYGHYMMMAFVMLSVTNVVNAPWMVWLLFHLLIVTMLGWSFWFFSSPTIATNRGLNFDQNRVLDAEETYLKEEIEHNTDMLNDDKSPQR